MTGHEQMEKAQGCFEYGLVSGKPALGQQRGQ